MDDLLKHLSQSLHQAQTREELVRPLLKMLEQITQLESTYLTTIDFEHAQQHVLYAHNTQEMHIPEGLTVPWSDTLCQHALAEGRIWTNQVQEEWGDSQAARALGIRTYASAPVRMSDGRIFGTLCAASARSTTLPADAENVLQLFAKLMAYHIEREQLLQTLQERNTQLMQLALTDPLTQLPNRTALRAELQRLLARAQRCQGGVLVAFVDLDNLKYVNDTYGHPAGDHLLCQVAHRLESAARSSDMVARIGGDEFVMASAEAVPTEDMPSLLQALQQRLRTASVCDVTLEDGRILHYPGASVGVVHVAAHTTVDQALQQADDAMYADKQQRGTQNLPWPAIQSR